MESSILKQVLGATDFVIMGLMLLVSAIIGLYFRFTGGRQKTAEEFLMAGKNMSIWPVAFSLMATYMSAVTVLGVPAEVYLYGTQHIMWLVGMPIGVFIAAYGMIPVFFDIEATTAYEYLEKRFGRTIRTIVSFLFVIQMMLYMAVVLYAPSLALQAVTGFSLWTSVISLAAVCTFYCSLGGLKAVLWTDLFQSFLMFITVFAIVVQGTISIGGFQRLHNVAQKGGRIILNNISMDLTTRYTVWNAIVSGIIFSASTYGSNQAQVQRILSVGNKKKARRAVFLSLPVTIIFNVFTFVDGLIIYALYHDCDPLSSSAISKADQLMPFTILKMFGSVPGLSGLCIAGIFSACLSTISSAINSLTAVTVEDFIKTFCFCKRLKGAWITLLAKCIAFSYGATCLILTYVVSNFRGLLEAANIILGLVGGPTIGVYVLGMMTQRTNELGAIIGLLFGFAINAWMAFGSYAAKVKIPTLSRSNGCATVFNNASVFLNGTDIGLSEDDTRDIFPLYKVAFNWYPMFGVFTVIVVGYAASYLINLFKEKKGALDEKLISPFVRRWFYHHQIMNEENNF